MKKHWSMALFHKGVYTYPTTKTDVYLAFAFFPDLLRMLLSSYQFCGAPMHPPNMVKAYLIAPKEITLSSATIFFGCSVNSSVIF